MRRVLFIPGFAKAGTTFLFDQLIQNTGLFNCPRVKELNYFSSSVDHSVDGFSKYFKIKNDDKLYIDSSPVYIQSNKNVAHVINSTMVGFDKKAIIVVRDPIDSFFSHYLHDMKSTVGRIAWRGTRPSDFSVDSPEVYRRYFRQRVVRVREFVEVFGDGCFGFHMKSLFNGEVEAFIRSTLGLDIKSFQSGQISNPGGFVPRYFYGGEKGRTFQQDGEEYFLPARALVSAANERSELILDLDYGRAKKILNLGKTYSVNISKPLEWFQPLIDDYVQTCKVLGLSPANKRRDELVEFTAPFGTVSQPVLDQLTGLKS